MITNDWLEVLQNAVGESDIVDVSDCYGAEVQVILAVGNTTPHIAGTRILIQTSSNTTGDEDWATEAMSVSTIGTANNDQPDAAVSVGATTITIGNTSGFDSDAVQWIFIRDDTLANSEICQVVSHVSNASITIQDGLTQAHGTTTSNLYNIVDVFSPVPLPFGAMRARVIFDNTLGGASVGAAVYGYARITKVTSVA
jgi:hypothetical protein